MMQEALCKLLHVDVSQGSCLLLHGSRNVAGLHATVCAAESVLDLERAGTGTVYY